MRIVCVHGAGESSSLWAGQVGALPDIRALNLPGHAGNPGSGLDSVSAYADWVAEELQGSPALILAGHSLGGAIALELALRSQRPEWLHGLILVGTGARLRVHPDIFAALDTRFDEAIELISAWSSGPQAVASAVESLSRDMHAAGPEVVRGDYRAANAFDVMDRVVTVDLPTMVIVGSEDRMTPLKYGEYLHSQIRQCSLVVVPGAGHLVTLERPREVGEAMAAFRHRVESIEKKQCDLDSVAPVR